MARQPRKMSEILKEMSDRLLRNPDALRSSEAAALAVMFANFAWNETIGLGNSRSSYRSAWESIEAENPQVWNEFKSNDVDAMIDELVQYKAQHFAGDQRRVLVCGVVSSKVRVEWVEAVAPGVDSRWEMRLYGLVRSGEREQAARFLQETSGMSRPQAMKRVHELAKKLGLR